jgi:hypothetical protein
VSATEASTFTGVSLPSRVPSPPSSPGPGGVGISPPQSPGVTPPSTAGRSPPKQTRSISSAPSTPTSSSDSKTSKPSSLGLPPSLSGISGPTAAGVVITDGEAKYRMADLAMLGARRVDLVRFSIVNDNRSFAIEPMLNGNAIGKKFIFRADNQKEQQLWFTALQSEQDPKFDQPITSLTAKPQTVVNSATGKAMGAPTGTRPGPVIIGRSATQIAHGKAAWTPSTTPSGAVTSDALAALPSFHNGGEEDDDDDDDDDAAYSSSAIEPPDSDDPDEDTRVLAKMNVPDMLLRLPKMNGNQVRVSCCTHSNHFCTSHFHIC